MYELSGKDAVVTGAGSGIGRALAQNLAAHGCKLALADINEAALAETAKLLPSTTLTQKLDVSDRAAVYAFAERVHRELGGARVVINNAGVALSQTVEKLSYEDFEWLMGINFWGVVYGTKAFLPPMLAARDGVMVNISSVFGIIGVPTQSAYNAAKFGVRGFTEALRHELEGSGVRAVCVHPGGIKTNIARASRHYVDVEGGTDAKAAADRFDRVAATTPAQAAEVIVNGILHGRERVLIGGDAKFISLIARLFPANYWKVLGAVMRKLAKK